MDGYDAWKLATPWYYMDEDERSDEPPEEEELFLERVRWLAEVDAHRASMVHHPPIERPTGPLPF